MEELLNEEVVANAAEEVVETLERTTPKWLKVGKAIVLVGAGACLCTVAYKKVVKPAAKKVAGHFKKDDNVLVKADETEKENS